MSSFLGELVPCGGGDPIPLVKPRLLVGRGRGCDVVLAFPTVSARHCELEFKDGCWLVRDLGSHNGIRVDGVRCESRRLMPNNTLSVAQQRYTIVYTPHVGQASTLARSATKTRGDRCATSMRPEEGFQFEGDRFEDSSLEMAGLGHLRREAAAGRSKQGSSYQSTLGELLPCGGGEPIPLLKPKLVVGRHAACDIVLGFPTVSSRHCELEFRKGYWFVRDLASRNGIRVDGAPCQSKWLMPNNILWLARHRYQIAYVPQAAEPPPAAEEHPFARSLLEKAGLVSSKDQEEISRSPLSRRSDPDAPREGWTLEE